MAMKRRARGRCEPVRWPSWTNPSAMRSCLGPFRQRCRLRGEACKVPIDVTSGHVASQMAIGIEHTLDDDHGEEIAGSEYDWNRKPGCASCDARLKPSGRHTTRPA